MPFAEVKLGGGLNKKAAGSDIADSQLQEATGCRFDVTGAVSSERGRELLDTFDDEIRGSFDSYRDGTKRRLLKAGTGVYEDETSIGTFTGTGYLSGGTFDSIDYLVDGTNQGAYNGTTLRTAIGLAGPTTAPTLTAVGAGSGLTAGTYQVRYSWVIKRSDDSTACETNLSPVDRDATLTGQITTTTADSITVGGFETAPTGATHIRIYRSVLNKKPVFFDGEIATGTSTYSIATKVPTSKGDEATAEDELETEDVIDETRPVFTFSNFKTSRYRPNTGVTELDNEANKKSGQGPNQSSGGPQIVQTNLGMLADWTDHDPAPSGLKHLIVHGQQLFGIAGKNIVFSRVGEPEHWPLFNAFQPGRNTGETLMSILPLGGELIIYTDTNVYRAISLDLSYEDARVVDTHSPVGLAAEWGVAQVTIGGRPVHLFIATSGLYIFDGNATHEIGFNVEHIFDGSSSDSASIGSLDIVRAISHRDKAWFSYPPATATDPGDIGGNNRTLFVDFQNPEEPKFSILPYGYTTLELEKKDGVVFGGDADGNTYEVDAGGTNGGESLTWAVKTKEYPISGTPNALVSLEAVVIDADIGGLLTSVVVSMDNGRSHSAFLSPVSGRGKKVVEVPNYMKGNRVAVRLENSGTSDRHLYGIGFKFRPSSPPTP